jgi:flagellum-specific ATP synthase
MSAIDHILHDIDRLKPDTFYGKVTKILGLVVEVTGIADRLSIGATVLLCPNDGRKIQCETIGFRDGIAIIMPFGTLEGVGLGCRAEIAGYNPSISPNDSWLGRVINALGEPLDGKGPLGQGTTPTLLKNSPPPANLRTRIDGKLDLGVRAINTFLSTCMGQRMGIFSGSGVGKSVSISMMARYTVADISVIGLVGERGREVQEFIEDDLGEEGLARSVVVVATGDEPPLMRRQAAYMTMAIAEHFRAEGRQVLCMIDSITRFAMAIREIGLSAGEPPTTKGYPPSMYGELARLLERAGPGVKGQGSITGLFSVLVEGDDMNEPVADAARGILDGHIVMDRAIADRGRYPAIDILKSVSRSMPDCLNNNQQEIVKKARSLIATYEDMAELIRLGAYRKGSDPKVDEAIQYYDQIEAFLSQNKHEQTSIDEGFTMLANILHLSGGAQ